MFYLFLLFLQDIIQLSILLNSSLKDSLRPYLGPITAFVVKLKQTGAISLSVFSLYLLNNIFSVI